MGLTTDFLEILKQDLTGQINLFTGAGFSTGAINKKGNKLPLGEELKKQLIGKFSYLSIDDTMDLPMIITIVSSNLPDEYRIFMDEIFTVK